MLESVNALYFSALGILALYGAHRYWILFLLARPPRAAAPSSKLRSGSPLPRVTVQIPLYNERYVAARLINAVCAFDYPRRLLDIQVLDDSTDDTRAAVDAAAENARRRGCGIDVIRRSNRSGFKAGALANGLLSARGEFIAIFDADFVPPPDFLRRALPPFNDPRVGVVQARWDHLNATHSRLTRVQSLLLDGHFLLEHAARCRAGAFINFNGTAGVWRATAIASAGGWSADTLTEDLDLSYRAQMKGWRFVFLPDLACPAELPADISALKSQQHRWAKGSVEAAKKLLPALWRGDFPWIVKMESAAHLCANAAAPVMLLLALLIGPSVYARSGDAPWSFFWIDAAAFALTTASVGVFYAAAARRGGRRWFRMFADVPALMAIGIGLSWNNAKAVLEAAAGKRSEFRRTPKFGEGDWRGARYRHRGARQGWPETAIGVYFLGLAAWCAASGLWASLPFIALFAAGFLYVGVLSLAHTADVARARSAAPAGLRITPEMPPEEPVLEAAGTAR